MIHQEENACKLCFNVKYETFLVFLAFHGVYVAAHLANGILFLDIKAL